MQKHKINVQALEKRFPARFPAYAPLPDKWKNGITGWHIKNPMGPGLYTMDVEHLPPQVRKRHNDPTSEQSVATKYNGTVCLHFCPTCFNREDRVYAKTNPDGTKNRMLDLEGTMRIIDDARAIAAAEGHSFESVKFLGPGELLMNPELFRIIEEYRKRGIILNIFTKGALLGSDRLAVRFHGQNGIKNARELVSRLATYENIGLIFSFQSFVQEIQDALVTRQNGGRIIGLRNYTDIRNYALENLFNSGFYAADGTTQRLCLINAPVLPQTIEDALDIYIFGLERGTPVITTPTMVSGLGKCQVGKQTTDAWHKQLIELYAQIHLYNLRKGVQTIEQIKKEEISSYAGTEPCNQVALGLYLRANGIVQMCPGRFDSSTIYGNVFETPLAEIWEKSPNRQLGMNPQMRLNNHCPAKDAHTPGENNVRAFQFGFYEKVMERLRELLKNK